MIKDIIENNQNKNINQDKINQLKQIIPNCFDKNGNLDIELLKKEFNSELNFTKESFELNFLGKSYAKMITGLETETVIEPDLEHNSKEENKNSENIYISGDNLDALKHLLKAYEGKIKCIYIDPPYNTGSDGFVYNDTFKFTKEILTEKLDIDSEEADRILNMTSGNCSSHSAWLTFMYPRLYLSRQLLSDDGAIFVSIGDEENNNLKLLMDSIYGEENYIATCPRKTRGSATTKSKAELQKLNDYVLIYLKNKEKSSFNLKIIGQKQYPYEDERGKYYTVALQDNGPSGTRTARPNLYYPIYKDEEGFLKLEKTKDTDIEFLPSKHKNDDGRWMWSKEKFKKDFKDLCIDKNIVSIKHYYNEEEDQNKYEQERNWLDKFLNAKGTSTLNEVFEIKGLFSNPKPIELLIFLIGLIADNNSIILDFFGGSSSTAHAVMKMNANDKGNGNRKYIIIQLPEDLKKNYETSDKEAKKMIENQINYLQQIGKPLFLDEIGQERIKKAAQKIKAKNNEKIDYGFKHYTLKETSDNLLTKLEQFNPYIINENYNLYKEYGIDTILETWKLKDGYEFTTNIETIDCNGYNVYKCEECLYLVEPNITIKNIEALLEQYSKDEKFTCNKLVLFGYSFKFNELEMIKNNIKQVKNFKNIDVKVYTRY